MRWLAKAGSVQFRDIIAGEVIVLSMVFMVPPTKVQPN